jgi:RHS repeat-associated protein
MVTRRSTGDVWSYPNIHGDVVATADPVGAKRGATLAFDPFGTTLSPPTSFAPDGLADNSAGNFDYGWLGQAQRGLEHAPGIATIEMGARPYVPGMGRFLEVDPVEGGSANDYDYCSGDPVNCNDVGGTKSKKKELSPIEKERLSQLVVNCSGPDASGADISGSGSCQRFWAAFAAGNLSEFGIGFIPRPAGACPSLLWSASRLLGYGDAFRAGYELFIKHDPGAALAAASGATGSNGAQYDLVKQFQKAGSKFAAEVAATVSGGASIGGTALDAVCTINS